MMDALKQLGMDYFHQDYDLMAPQPVDVVRDFVQAASGETVKQLRVQIDQALIERDEAQLQHLWVDECDAYFEPNRHGMTTREWFEQMRAVVDEVA